MAEVSLLNNTNTVDFSSPNVEIRGFNDLKKRLAELGDEFSRNKTARIWNRIIQNSFLPALVAARAAAPVRTGVLKAGIGIASQRAKSRDLVSKYVQPGTTFLGRVTSSAKRPTDKVKTYITKRRKKDGTARFNTYRSSRPIPFWLEYGTTTFSARNYLRSALASTQGDVLARAEDEIKLALDELTRKWGSG